MNSLLMRGECIPREHDVDVKGSVCKKEQMESLTAVKNNVAFDLHAVRSEWQKTKEKPNIRNVQLSQEKCRKLISYGRNKGEV